MNLNLRRIVPSMLIAACFAVSGSLEVNGQEVFLDTFDAAPTGGATRVLSVDNSGSITPGTFPDSRFDVFGIVDRNVNFDFADDTVINNADADPANDDTFGLVKPEKTDLFLGFADTVNNNNEGPVSVTWTVPVNGQTGLTLSFDIAAMGDFETDDLLVFSASFDGGTPTTIVQSTIQDTPENDGSDPNNPPANGFDLFTYTLDDGSLAVPFFFGDPPEVPESIKDPFAFDVPGAGITLVINEFQTFTFPISGTGTELTLTLDYITNGGPEPMAIDNVTVTAGATTGLTGDFNGDDVVDCADVDEYSGVLGLAPIGLVADFDLDSDNDIDLADVEFLITNLVVTTPNGATGTFLGDLDCNGTVDVLGDAFILIGSLGSASTSYAEGDIDLNGTVDVLGDAFILIGNLGMNNSN